MQILTIFKSDFYKGGISASSLLELHKRRDILPFELFIYDK
jgi:hypothetical protein